MVFLCEFVFVFACVFVLACVFVCACGLVRACACVCACVRMCECVRFWACFDEEWKAYHLVGGECMDVMPLSLFFRRGGRGGRGVMVRKD